MKIEKYEIFTWLAVETSKRIRENIYSPRYGRPRGIFATIARDFQIISKLKFQFWHSILCGWIFILQFDRSLQNDLQKFNSIKYCWIT